MSTAGTLDIKLSRSERQPWGFRLHGGSDFGTPLIIQKVNSSSISEMAGMVAGDLLVAVNGEDVQTYRHKEAQDTIVRSGNNLTITIRRGSVLSKTLKGGQPAGGRLNPQAGQGSLVGGGGPAGPAQPQAGDEKWTKVLDLNRAGAAMDAETFTQEFMSQLMGANVNNLPPPVVEHGLQHELQQQHQPQQQQQHQPQQQLQQNGVRISTPTGTLTKSNNKMPSMANPMNTKQYNTPQPLYSQENVEDILNQQAEMLSNGVKGINFASYKREPKVPHNSEVLKLLREREQEDKNPKSGVKGMSQENRNCNSNDLIKCVTSFL